MAEPNWQWSDALQTKYYRGADGTVHYGTGPSSGPNTTWQDATGRSVYAQNSAGPASTAGGAYQDQGGMGIGSNPLMPNGQPANQSMMGANTGSAPAGQYDTRPMQMATPSGAGPSFGGGVGSSQPAPGALSTAGASTAGQNPYLQQMGNQMVGQMTDNFARRVMPSIASGAMAAGNFGGSRQGVVEANAMNDLNGQIGGALTNLYGNGFNTALNYDLGLRGNDLGFAGLDAQINQNNFNNRLQGANFGLGLWNQGMANNQTGINAGTNIQNTPMNYWSQFGNQYNSIGQGFGTTTGSASQQGNPLMGALGGAQLGSQIGNWWGGGGGTGMTGSNAPASSYNIGSFDYGIGGGGGGGLGLKF